ncbi:MAG: hypothetical protein Q9165_000972 [Trypethelium subeluteriae]
MQSEKSPKTKCLQQISELFPNIDVEYVNRLYEERISENVSCYRACELIIDQLCEAPSYPTNPSKQQIKRKHALDDEGPANKLRRSQRVGQEQMIDEPSERTEEENERLARKDGAIFCCQCCFSEVPTNRTVFCSGSPSHGLCWDCIRRYVDVEFGKGKYEFQCFGAEDCTAKFNWQEDFHEFVNENILAKLWRLQQDEEIKLAHLENVEGCPFCGFQAICDQPTGSNKEFECAHPECGKVSCRLCHKERHAPLSCEEHRKNKKTDAKHTVEEAMTEALVRKCNKCRNPFIKEDGCNKMTCPKCSNTQCYICSADINSNYDHFFQDIVESSRGCPLYGGDFNLHKREVRKAEKTAIAKAMADNSELVEADLKVQVSEEVRRHEERQREKAREPGPVLLPPFVDQQNLGPIHVPPPPRPIARPLRAATRRPRRLPRVEEQAVPGQPVGGGPGYAPNPMLATVPAAPTQHVRADPMAAPQFPAAVPAIPHFDPFPRYMQQFEGLGQFNFAGNSAAPGLHQDRLPGMLQAAPAQPVPMNPAPGLRFPAPDPPMYNFGVAPLDLQRAGGRGRLEPWRNTALEADLWGFNEGFEAFANGGANRIQGPREGEGEGGVADARNDITRDENFQNGFGHGHGHSHGYFNG